MLETKRLIIRPIKQEDLEVLSQWRNSDPFQRLCSTRRNSVTMEEFEQELRGDFIRDRYQQLIGLKKKDQQPVGTIWAYGLNSTDGYVFLSIFIDPIYEKRGYGVDLFLAQMQVLFDSLPNLHKIYTEAYSYNLHSLALMKKFGFAEEGVFREHRVYEGERYDLHRLAFYREQMLEKVDFISKVIS